MNIIVTLFIALAICILLIFCVNKYLKYKNGDIMKIHQNAIYNGKDTNLTLSTINNIGYRFYGDFRRDTNGSTVKYLFFCFFFPLFPIGCYRATEGPTEFHVKHDDTKYIIYGTEKWNVLEILIIYLYMLAAILVCIIIYNSWDYIF